MTRLQSFLLLCFIAALGHSLSRFSQVPKEVWPSQLLGLLGAVVVVVVWFRLKQQVSALTLLPAVILVLYCTYRGFVFHHLAAAETTFDNYALYVDRAFGFQPSLWCFRLVDRLHSFSFLNLVYGSLTFAMGLTFATHIRPQQRPWRAFFVLVLAGFLGSQCYRLLPICGPVYLLGSECYTGEIDAHCADMAASDLQRVQLNGKWPRNGMPSLHLAWALLICLLCRDLKRGKWVALVFLCLTTVATLGGGEHYLIDLVGSLPFSVVIWFLCDGSIPLGHPNRMLPIAGGCATFLLWISWIHFAPASFAISPLVPWLASFAIIAGSLSCLLVLSPTATVPQELQLRQLSRSTARG